MFKKLLTSLNISIPLIPTEKSSPRAVVFKIELIMGQVLSPMFRNADIIVGLVSEYIDVEPTVV